MVEVLPIAIMTKKGKFGLFESLQGFAYRDSDIVVISSKFVSMSEGSLVSLSKIKPSKKARALAEECHMSAKLAELVLRESDYIIRGGVPGFLLAIRDGMIAPNAGIDKSNVPAGYAILYPRDAFGTAEQLRQKFLLKGLRIGIVIADSRLMPTRIGTTGVAIACAGFEPVEDQRGRKDLFGNVLRVTFKAVADGIATMGVAAMGESDESTPVAVVRDAKVEWTDRRLSWRDMAVEPGQDIYLRSRIEKRV